MNLDSGYFYCLLRDGDPKPFTRVPRHWIDADWHPVYDFVRECLGNPEMKKMPQADTVAVRFNREFHHTDEDIGFYIDLLCKRSARLALEDGVLKELMPMIQDPSSDITFDPIGAAEKMLKLCAQIRSKYQMRDDFLPMDYTTDIGSRIAGYNKRKARQGMVGIPYPFEPMNYATGGMVGGEVSVILARGGVGKTWVFSHVINHAIKNGYKVLACSQEMGKDELAERIDAIGAGVSPERFWRGTLSPEEEERVKRYYMSLKEYTGNVFIYGANNVTSFEEFTALLMTKRAQIDLVVWDSPYLVVRADKWEKKSEFCYELKKCAEEFNVPFLLTWQLNRKGEPAFTEAIFTDVHQNFIITNENIKQLKQLLMYSLKTRRGLELEKMLLKWDTAEGIADVLAWSIPGYGDSYEDYVVEDE